MERLYHGCMLKNADGTNRIIAADEKCLVPTCKCFWKGSCNVKHGVKTGSRAKNEPTIDCKAFDNYRAKKEFTDRWVLGKEQKSN